jgi:hypothetical protein
VSDREKILVLGVDPGSGTVGWSLGRGQKIEAFGQMLPNDFLMAMEDTAASRVVIERFDIRQFTVDAYRTVEIIGAIKWICRRRALKIGIVNAADKVKFLQTISLDVRDHARDAEAVRLYDLAYGQW